MQYLVCIPFRSRFAFPTVHFNNDDDLFPIPTIPPPREHPTHPTTLSIIIGTCTKVLFLFLLSLIYISSFYSNWTRIQEKLWIEMIFFMMFRHISRLPLIPLPVSSVVYTSNSSGPSYMRKNFHYCLLHGRIIYYIFFVCPFLLLE